MRCPVRIAAAFAGAALAGSTQARAQPASAPGQPAGQEQAHAGAKLDPEPGASGLNPEAAAYQPGEKARRLLDEALLAARSPGGTEDDLIARFRAATEVEPRWALARIDLAVALDRAGRAADAEEAFRAALSGQGASAAALEASALRARSLALERGDGAAARSSLELLAKALPGSLGPLELRAELEAELGDASAAQLLARSVLARAPGSVRALCALARAHLIQGAPGTARLLARRARDAAPEQALPQLTLARVERAAGEPAAELAALKAAREAEPGSPQAALALGQALLSRGLPGPALAELEQAARLAPGSGEVHLWLTRALAAQEQPLKGATKGAPRAPVVQGD